ncbi:hypothetical protein GIB67_039652 [Kingdonia uniflora]|uniref:Uncharacterized protein n=1 Tax=Kingdonia uniflora TaxID=39325 RepID=A0A7J7MDI5_9MAGN|nr:hypothetical protein GIB67_039652 [Kingdonia uniflora]
MKVKYFTKNGDIIRHYKKSSMWAGIKSVYNDVTDNTFWSIGDGTKVHAWINNWTGLGPFKDVPALSHILSQAGVNLSNILLGPSGMDKSFYHPDYKVTSLLRLLMSRLERSLTYAGGLLSMVGSKSSLSRTLKQLSMLLSIIRFHASFKPGGVLSPHYFNSGLNTLREYNFSADDSAYKAARLAPFTRE